MILLSISTASGSGTPSLPLPLQDFACASLGSTVLCAGGYYFNGPPGAPAVLPDTVYSYDEVSRDWSALPGKLSVARWGLVAGSAGNKIIFASGSTFPPPNGGGFGSVQIVDMYDVNTQQWTSSYDTAGQLSTKRLIAMAASTATTFVVAGGLYVCKFSAYELFVTETNLAP